MEGFPTRFIAALLLIFSSSIGSTLAARSISSNLEAANTEFIRTSCTTTAYPKLCFTSLSTQANIVRQDPKLLAHAALTLSLNSAHSSASSMVAIAKTHGLAPRETAAMRDCVEELRDSVDQIRRSIGEMNQLKGSKFGLKMSDIQTWISAALTDDDTCTEGFGGKVMNGEIKTAVRAKLVNVVHLTSNALALTNNYAALHN